MSETLFDFSDEQTWVTPYEFSKIVGVSAEAVMKAIKNGRFDNEALRTETTKSGSGKDKYKINLEIGRLQWSQSRTNSAGLTDKVFKDAKRREQIARAKIEELKYEELSGRLINIEEVRRQVTRIAITVRDALLNESMKAAPALSDMTDVKEIENFLKARLSECLEDLSDAAASGKVC